MNRTVLIDVKLENDRPQNIREAFELVDNQVKYQNSLGYKVVSVAPLTASQSIGNSYAITYTVGILLVFEMA